MAPSGRFVPRAASPFMGRMSSGCCSSSGPAPSASAASLAIRLWDPRVATHPSLSSLSGSCWTCSTNRSPRGPRPRADTGCVEPRAVGTRPHGGVIDRTRASFRTAKSDFSLIQLRQRRNPRSPGFLSAANSLTCKRSDLLESAQEVAHGVSFGVSFSLLRSDFSSRGTPPTAQNTAYVLPFVVRRYTWSPLRDQEVGGSNPLAPTE